MADNEKLKKWIGITGAALLCIGVALLGAGLSMHNKVLEGWGGFIVFIAIAMLYRFAER